MQASAELGMNWIKGVAAAVALAGIAWFITLAAMLWRPWPRPVTGFPSKVHQPFNKPLLRSPEQHHYLAVLLAAPGCSSYFVDGAFGDQWVGAGCPTGRHVFTHALIWRHHGRTIIDLNPKGFEFSLAIGTDGKFQVGSGNNPAGLGGGALLWSGSAASVVVLNPEGCYFSQAGSVRDGIEIGYVEEKRNGPRYAALWRGTAASFVNLNPPGFLSSAVMATDGRHQVGVGKLPNGKFRALLWSGAPTGAVVLGSHGYASAAALAISGNTIAGAVRGNGTSRRAVIWRGGKHRIVDLNPPGFTSSIAAATNGAQEVGYGQRQGGLIEALVWSGTAHSAVDLQSFLPASYTVSRALAITSKGLIFGFAKNRGGKRVAVEWIPVEK